MSSRGVLTCGSITVSSAWELTSVYMRYSQREGVNTSLSRITYCTHVVVFFFFSCTCVPFVARSCATKDANYKDNVWKPSIPAGINCPPPSKIISPITWFGIISTAFLSEAVEEVLVLRQEVQDFMELSMRILRVHHRAGPSTLV